MSLSKNSISRKIVCYPSAPNEKLILESYKQGVGGFRRLTQANRIILSQKIKFKSFLAEI